jgi:predicted SAM-dependent methyltransferase
VTAPRLIAISSDAQQTAPSDEMQLAQYLEQLRNPRATLEDVFASPNAAAAPAPRLKRVAKAILPVGMRVSLRERWRTTVTDVLRPWEQRRARRIAQRQSAVRLHLGSGYLHKDGWVNVDLAVMPTPTELRWNLVHPMPFEPNTVDAVFHEHLLEHIPAEHALSLLKDSYRVLRSGGILRIGVPDAGAYARSYVSGGRGMIESQRPGRPTAMLALQELFYRYNHRTMFDGETLTLFCRAAGFDEARVMTFGESAIEPCPDSVERRDETLYVEAVKW